MTPMTSPSGTRRRLLGAVALAVTLLSTGAAFAADPSQFSEAEKLVFVENQLANIKPPASLHYSFVKSGSYEPGFKDDVTIDIKPGASNKTIVQGRFLSGERELKLPDIPDAEANPVVLFFLERDIREMERLTKGKANYFRKRIRMTMADGAKVRDTRITFDGKEVPAKEVSLAPYVNDPMRPRFERYAGKLYTFVLCNAVPGGVYQVRTVINGDTPGAPPGLEEVLTFTGPARHTAASSTSSQPSAKR